MERQSERFILPILSIDEMHPHSIGSSWNKNDTPLEEWQLKSFVPDQPIATTVVERPQGKNDPLGILELLLKIGLSPEEIKNCDYIKRNERQILLKLGFSKEEVERHFKQIQGLIKEPRDSNDPNTIKLPIDFSSERIAELKFIYPMYKDIPDNVLADLVYKKFYADKMSLADFLAKMGTKIPTSLMDSNNPVQITDNQ
jgi:hypothetical protein